MDLTGSYLVDAPRQQVWAHLLDPRALSACVPGVQSLDLVDTNTYRATMTAGAGPVSGTFEGTVALADIVAPDSYRLVVQGKGRPGFVNGSAHVRLTDEGSATRVEVRADVQVGGLIASVGQRLLGSVSKTMMDKFFACMAASCGRAA
jgi:carbon monoxide dehydrogenase subunit G